MKRTGAVGETDWPIRKAQECIEAHEDPHFGEPVETEGISAEEVAGEILRRLREKTI